MEYHSPVLLDECIEGLSINPDGIYIDATFGGGGHSKLILSKLRNGKLFAFDQDLIDSLEKEPKDLTTFTILKQIEFLTDNKLRAEVFEVELYKRLVKPITLVSMVLLAMLFIFGSTRDATLGRKIFFGVVIGLSFELISRIGGALALSFDFSPLLGTFVPTIAIMIIATIVLINKSIH